MSTLRSLVLLTAFLGFAAGCKSDTPKAETGAPVPTATATEACCKEGTGEKCCKDGGTCAEGQAEGGEAAGSCCGGAEKTAGGGDPAEKK